MESVGSRTGRLASVSRELYEVEGAPGPSLLGTGEGGETDWQLGIHSTTATYDALGRMVEIGSGRTYTQFAYRPDGVLLALYSSEPVKTTIPLPGGSTAIYNSTGLDYIRHTDWLGSSRLATTWNHTVYSKEAYAPFGETYNEAGTPDRSFTGQDQDVVTGSAGTGIYDFLFRKYDPSAGRWLSPDPYGWGAVDLTAPQSLNRYAYVMNNALSYVDPLGYKLCQTIAVNAKGSESGFDPTWCGYYYYQNWGEGGGGGSGGGSGGRGGGGGGGRGGASSSGSNSNFDPTDPGYQLAVAFQQNGTYTITDWRFIPSFYGASLAGAGALVAAPAVGAAASSGASYIANASGMLGPAAGRIFWSAIGATRAAEWAEERGYVSLETTPLGGFANWAQNFLPQTSTTGAIWNWLSSAYANGAQGSVLYLQGSRLGDMWLNTELPILTQNGNPVGTILIR